MLSYDLVIVFYTLLMMLVLFVKLLNGRDLIIQTSCFGVVGLFNLLITFKTFGINWQFLLSAVLLCLFFERRIDLEGRVKAAILNLFYGLSVYLIYTDFKLITFLLIISSLIIFQQILLKNRYESIRMMLFKFMIMIAIMVFSKLSFTSLLVQSPLVSDPLMFQMLWASVSLLIFTINSLFLISSENKKDVSFIELTLITLISLFCGVAFKSIEFEQSMSLYKEFNSIVGLLFMSFSIGYYFFGKGKSITKNVIAGNALCTYFFFTMMVNLEIYTILSLLILFPLVLVEKAKIENIENYRMSFSIIFVLNLIVGLLLNKNEVFFLTSDEKLLLFLLVTGLGLLIIKQLTKVSKLRIK